MFLAIEKICNLGGPSLGEKSPLFYDGFLDSDSPIREILNIKNGFYVFESSLHVFPSGNDKTGGYSLEEWNSNKLWRYAYGDKIQKKDIFFSQDAFGGQFLLRKNAVCQFDSETGIVTPYAKDIASWCNYMILDWRVITGYPLAHEWQLQHGPLGINQRLAPKTPFVLGGTFDIENLYLADAASLMRQRADLALQIADFPDGTDVRIVIQSDTH